MKICWDNLENIYLSSNGNLRKGHSTYYEKICGFCKELYLGSKRSTYCSKSCRALDINPMYNKCSRNKVSEKARERFKNKKNHPWYGRKHKEETKQKITGPNSPNWRGGYGVKGLPRYDLFNPKIKWCEETRRCPDDRNILEVKCTYCEKWYIPTYISTVNRDASLRNIQKNENRFYCSEECKRGCPIYNQKLWPKGFKKTTYREVQPELRQMVFERDDWTCQRCGERGGHLHCHHITGVELNPIESADIDNCITACKKCHKWIHSQDGCKQIDMRC